MQYRGPDIPFVLYSYVVFAMVSHDEDYMDIVILLERAKKAEQVLRCVNSLMTIILKYTPLC